MKIVIEGTRDEISNARARLLAAFPELHDSPVQKGAIPAKSAIYTEVFTEKDSSGGQKV